MKEEFKMRKILSVALACSMAFALAGCSGGTEETTAAATTTAAAAAEETTVAEAEAEAEATTAAAEAISSGTLLFFLLFLYWAVYTSDLFTTRLPGEGFQPTNS